MNAIFDASGASEYERTPSLQLMEELGFSDQEFADACKFLEGEYLIKGDYMGWDHYVGARTRA